MIVRVLSDTDGAVLDNVADDVFDHPLKGDLVRQFLEDPRHHIAVAIDDAVVVGFASGVHYLHPDKEPELFINEVGVAPSHHRRGLGKQLMHALLEHGRGLGCREAWVLTEKDNRAARALYSSAGGNAEGEAPVLFSFDLK